jgi:hypothetical protein
MQYPIGYNTFYNTQRQVICAINLTFHAPTIADFVVFLVITIPKYFIFLVICKIGIGLTIFYGA